MGCLLIWETSWILLINSSIFFIKMDFHIFFFKKKDTTQQIERSYDWNFHLIQWHFPILIVTSHPDESNSTIPSSSSCGSIIINLFSLSTHFPDQKWDMEKKETKETKQDGAKTTLNFLLQWNFKFINDRPLFLLVQFHHIPADFCVDLTFSFTILFH